MNIGDEIINLIRKMKPSYSPVEKFSNLYTDLGFDSLTFIKLLIAVEETCCITIGIMDMEKCLRVDRLIALAEKKAKEAGYA